MIHITKSKTGYMVVTVADNGEPLATSEVLSAKRHALNNMEAQACQFSAMEIVFQDDTGKKPVLKSWKFGRKSVKTLSWKPAKKYQPKK